MLACGTTDEVVQLWLTGSGKQVKKNLKTAGPVTSLDWLHDGRLLATGGENMTLQIWDWPRVETIDNLWAFGAIEYVRFSPKGALAVAGAANNSVFVWRRVGGQRLGVIIEEDDHVLLLDAKGHYRIDPAYQPDIVFVAQTSEAQLTLSPADFAAQYHWTNRPEAVKFTVGD